MPIMYVYELGWPQLLARPRNMNGHLTDFFDLIPHSTVNHPSSIPVLTRENDQSWWNGTDRARDPVLPGLGHASATLLLLLTGFKLERRS